MIKSPHRNRPGGLATKPPASWSIGIFTGDSPLALSVPPEIQNPVITSDDVSDVPAQFVADPFMIRENDDWYMFFEVKNGETNRGQIGLATSQTGLSWEYHQIVLEEPYHLSYPYVFEWEDEHYMIPETLAPGSVLLYKAVCFPTDWSVVKSLLSGTFADPSVCRFNDKWWMFVCGAPYKHDLLRLFFSDELTGDWVEHPKSPIVESDNRIARPGGRVLVLGERVIRYAQDCYPSYGTQVRAFEITELTTDSYREEEAKESPVLAGGDAWWNGSGVHHIDPHPTAGGRWMACVDGYAG
jgi:hypothetical protein